MQHVVAEVAVWIRRRIDVLQFLTVEISCVIGVCSVVVLQHFVGLEIGKLVDGDTGCLAVFLLPSQGRRSRDVTVEVIRGVVVHHESLVATLDGSLGILLIHQGEIVVKLVGTAGDAGIILLQQLLLHQVFLQLLAVAAIAEVVQACVHLRL